jgi:hypothetical protein
MNENPTTDAREQMIGSFLSKAVVCEEQLKKGLPAMLEKSGITPKFQQAIQEFLKPLIDILGAMEREFIQQMRKEQITDLLEASVRGSQTSSFEAWADIFSRLSNTPQQMKAANDFKAYVNEMIKGKEPEKGREQSRDRVLGR